MEGVCTSIQMAGLRYITHFWWDPRPFHPYACGRRTGSVNGHQFAEAAGQAANTIQDIQSGAGANFELSIETGEVSRAIASCARRYGADLVHWLAGPQPQHEVQPQRNDLKNRPGRECF